MLARRNVGVAGGKQILRQTLAAVQDWKNELQEGGNCTGALLVRAVFLVLLLGFFFLWSSFGHDPLPQGVALPVGGPQPSFRLWPRTRYMWIAIALTGVHTVLTVGFLPLKCPLVRRKGLPKPVSCMRPSCTLITGIDAMAWLTFTLAMVHCVKDSTATHFNEPATLFINGSLSSLSTLLPVFLWDIKHFWTLAVFLFVQSVVATSMITPITKDTFNVQPSALYFLLLFQIMMKAGTILFYQARSRVGRMRETETRQLERKENKERTLRKRLQNEVASKILAESYVFHEVRVPFHTLTMGMEYLTETIEHLPHELRAQTRYLLKTMRDSSKCMARVLDDVLDANRIQMGRLTISPQRFKVLNLCNQAVSQVNHSAQNKSISINVTVPSYLQHLSLLGDWRRLSQVLLNLLSNAVKFTKEGGNITVKVSGDVVDSRIADRTMQIKRLFIGGEIPASTKAGQQAGALRPLSPDSAVSPTSIEKDTKEEETTTTKPRRSVSEVDSNGYNVAGLPSPTTGMQRAQTMSLHNRVRSLSVVSRSGGSRSDARSEEETSSVDATPRETNPSAQQTAVIRIKVADEGPGVRPEDAQKIFLPFYQSQVGAHRQSSTGLGLYISNAIVGAHNGSMHLKNRKSREGANFSFILPLPVAEPAVIDVEEEEDLPEPVVKPFRPIGDAETDGMSDEDEEDGHSDVADIAELSLEYQNARRRQGDYARTPQPSPPLSTYLQHHDARVSPATVTPFSLVSSTSETPQPRHGHQYTQVPDLPYSMDLKSSRYPDSPATWSHPTSDTSGDDTHPSSISSMPSSQDNIDSKFHPSQSKSSFRPSLPIRIRDFAPSGRSEEPPPPLVTLQHSISMPTPTGTEEPPVAPPSQPASAGKILIVDDSAPNRMLLKFLLRRLRFNVSEAGSGAEALAMCKLTPEGKPQEGEGFIDYPYDAVLIDYKMSGLNGAEVTERMKNAGIKTPVVAVTGAAHDEMQCLYDAGVVAILKKPIWKSQLVKTLRGLHLPV